MRLAGDCKWEVANENRDVMYRSHGLYTVVMAPCLDLVEKDNTWDLTDGQQLHHRTLDVCLDHRGLQPEDHLVAAPCTGSSDSQRWRFVNQEGAEKRRRHRFDEAGGSNEVVVAATGGAAASPNVL